MAMSDAEYARIVSELKQSKEHITGYPESEQKLTHSNLVGFLEFIQTRVTYLKGDPSQLARIQTLLHGCQRLKPWQVDDTLYGLANAAWRSLVKAPIPENFDHTLAQLQVELERTQRRDA